MKILFPGLAFLTAFGAGSSNAAGDLTPRAGPYNGADCTMARQLIAAGHSQQAIPWARSCASRGGSIAIPLPVIAAPLPVRPPARYAPPTAPVATAPGAPPPRVPAAPTQPVLPQVPPAPTWIDDLPTKDAIFALFPGPDEEAKASRVAALEVMAKFIEGLTGGSRDHRENLPPVAAKRIYEYWVPTRSEGLIPENARCYVLAELYEFQAGVLTKLVAKPSQDAYWTTPIGRKYKQEGDMRAAMGIRVVGLATATDEARAKMRASVEPDLAAATHAHIGTNVLGIELGQPLHVQSCPDSGSGGSLAGIFAGTFDGVSPLPEPCKTSGGFGDLFNKLSVTGELAPLAGTEDIVVRLPATKCPDWVSCSLVVTVKDDYVIMVSLLTRGSSSFREVEDKLSAKYGGKPTGTLGDSKCQLRIGLNARVTTDTAPSKIWDRPGLNAIYVPYGSMMSCDQGAIIVKLDAYDRLREEVKQRHDAAQPKF